MRQDVIDHLEKIQRMRSAQNKYFRARTLENLTEAKRLETEIDEETPRLLARLTAKPNPNN